MRKNARMYWDIENTQADCARVFSHISEIAIMFNSFKFDDVTGTLADDPGEAAGRNCRITNDYIRG
jgi:hypothetical protein